MSTPEEKEATKREEERLARAIERKQSGKNAAKQKPAWKVKLEEEEARKKKLPNKRTNKKKKVLQQLLANMLLIGNPNKVNQSNPQKMDKHLLLHQQTN